MYKTSTENETSQKEIIKKNSTIPKEDQEQSDEETEISNMDLDQSFDNNFSIIQYFSFTLNDYIIQNEKKKVQKNSSHYYDSDFSCKTIPNISIEDYLKRIIKYTQLEESTLIIALIYIDRILENKNFKLSKYNVFRVLLSAILIAIKYNEDEIYDNSCFAEIFGLNIKELNKLESKFLELIDFKLFTSNEELELYFNKL